MGSTDRKDRESQVKKLYNINSYMEAIIMPTLLYISVTEILLVLQRRDFFLPPGPIMGGGGASKLCLIFLIVNVNLKLKLGNVFISPGTFFCHI